MSDDKGYIESAVEKTKELASDAKEKLVDTYDRLVGNNTEDKAARNIKDKTDKAADKIGDARDSLGNKMRQGARKLEGSD